MLQTFVRFCVLQIVATTLISSYTHLSSNYTVSVVGEIPSGYGFGLKNCSSHTVKLHCQFFDTNLLHLFFILLCFRLISPSVPDVSLFREVIGDAFAVAIVGYAISISLGKTFALKHGYKVDSNQVNQKSHQMHA